MAKQHIAPGTPARRRRQQRAVDTMTRHWGEYEKKAAALNAGESGAGNRYLARQQACLDNTRRSTTVAYGG
jgi:hypothetical protein